MEPHKELDSLIGEAIDSLKTSILTLETASPLLDQRHRMFGGEATRLVATLRLIQSDVIALLDANDVDPEFDALTLPAMTEVRVCAICGHGIQPREPSVPTTNGDSVHIACANQLAAQAQRRRERWALVHGVVLLGVVIIVGFITGITPWLIVFTAVGGALHIALHRRWWYYVRRDMGKWLLLGARQ